MQMHALTSHEDAEHELSQRLPNCRHRHVKKLRWQHANHVGNCCPHRIHNLHGNMVHVFAQEGVHNTRTFGRSNHSALKELRDAVPGLVHGLQTAP